ncbi:hypothetical protein PPK16_gp35 [Bacillus phage 049ML001]|uniref:Uncharacterized protein n=1 Tax=Bacillus phage 049ML001 TaxID=2601660 RepID=A0A5P8PHX1_9CAUD|nr:hypothetical protein PPK16_gp35 [Bacillus phage 049ML001]QFR56338.1 hypothetical protein 049ML001_35 [Bacillus phage 049ML001]QFR56466.1 hypothetical protein 049ML003_35 [Bacillus phage 049ML003]
MITYSEAGKYERCNSCLGKASTRLSFEMNNHSTTIRLCATCLYELDEKTRMEISE